MNVNIPLSEADRVKLNDLVKREHTSYGRLFLALLLRAHEGSMDVASALAALPAKGTPGPKTHAPVFNNDLHEIYFSDPDFKIKERFRRMGYWSITQEQLEKERADAIEDAAKAAAIKAKREAAESKASKPKVRK